LRSLVSTRSAAGRACCGYAICARREAVMKTTTDIGSFLKRITSANANTPASLTLLHDGKAFIVKHGNMSSRSAYLDDALENIAEETRRSANRMESVRETKAALATSSGGGGGGAGYVTLSVSPSKPPTPYPSSCAGCGAVAAAYCVCKS